jgi:Asp-tRNA(Asn)/Glu-tRNA(Gln) amidotransferase A subunit family amidase
MLQQALLFETAAALRSGKVDLLSYVNQVCTRLEEFDGQIESMLPEPNRRERLHREALELQQHFPDPDSRPPLYGVLVGVKDIFHVDGFETRAGSALPPGVLTGAEASNVTRLREAGALLMGKTVTTEFAYFEPGPTHNPRNLAHTPGGSSSGSAAAVAAGFCSLALGTQTIGSMIRPAAYCGVIGFKPSYGRIATDGVIPIAAALDHVGMFTQDVEGMELAASILCEGWQTAQVTKELPTLGIPVGAYLEQASEDALDIFEQQVEQMQGVGYKVKRIPLLDEIKTISEHTFRIMAVQMSQVHHEWFAQYEALYRPRTRQMIERGQQVTPDELAYDLALQRETRDMIAASMEANGIDLWISPAATTTAPQGLNSTGDPAMNLPWTLIGFPTITLPSDLTDNDGLPYGQQVSAPLMGDELLLQWSKHLIRVLNP